MASNGISHPPKKYFIFDVVVAADISLRHVRSCFMDDPYVDHLPQSV